VPLRLQVECYSGYRAEERPLRFRMLAPGATSREVVEILDRWYGVGYRCFKVRADDGNIYILRHLESEDAWELDSYRNGAR
jgi:hypothetical protein